MPAGRQRYEMAARYRRYTRGGDVTFYEIESCLVN